jgi:hypothetical protein
MREIDSIKLMMGIVFFTIISITIFTLGMIAMSYTGYHDENCTFIKNVSESRTTTSLIMMPMGKSLMPMPHTYTEYHTYNVCLNGSIYDVGWR